MSSISSAGLEASVSGSKEPGCEPLPSVSQIRSAGLSWPDGGRISPAILMYESFQQTGSAQTAFDLMSSAEASLVRTSLSQALARASKVKDQVYGRTTADLLANFDPATSSWRTSQRCLIEGWTEFSETWPRSGLMRNGTAYRLPTLAPLISEIASGLLPTPRRSGQSRGWKAYLRKNYQGNLEEYLGEIGLRGWINPKFVEWMIGLPIGWTVTSHSATRSSRKSRKSSDEQS